MSGNEMHRAEPHLRIRRSRRAARGLGFASWLLAFLVAGPSCGRGGRVELRPLPYPYRAGLAIASDIDETDSAGEFLLIQRYLADTGPTPLGEGLGLEVGNSFWFYDATGRSRFTYFQDLAGTPAPEAELIEEFIAAGYIDCVHSYGDFSQGGFERSLAPPALRALEDIRNRRGVAVRVWVDHGNPLNRQNLGALSYQRGDDPWAPEYHADLLLACGIKFLGKWEVTHLIGQDVRRQPVDYVKELGVLAVYGKNVITRTEQTPYLWTNRLIHPTRLDDGQPIFGFRRFINSWGRGSVDARGLADQLSADNLQQLLRKGGYMVIYTHLGGNEGITEYLPPETRQALMRLSRLHRAGDLLVTTTSRLLTYNLSTERLRWRAEVVGEEATVMIELLEDEVEGPHPPRPEELMGLTFYVPSAARARVVVGGEEVRDLVRNPPDETGRESVGFPWRPLCFPPAASLDQPAPSQQ